MDDNESVTTGSGNVFADLGFDDPEMELDRAHKRMLRALSKEEAATELRELQKLRIEIRID
jgi:hypothetical protein